LDFIMHNIFGAADLFNSKILCIIYLNPESNFIMHNIFLCDVVCLLPLDLFSGMFVGRLLSNWRWRSFISVARPSARVMACLQAVRAAGLSNGFSSLPWAFVSSLLSFAQILRQTEAHTDHKLAFTSPPQLSLVARTSEYHSRLAQPETAGPFASAESPLADGILHSHGMLLSRFACFAFPVACF
jgi:hypothetical protein